MCHLAGTERDKSLIKYAACRSSGLGSKQSQQVYGVSNLGILTERVEASLHQEDVIRNEIMSLASVEEKAVLQSFGIDLHDCDDSSDSFSSSDTETPVELNWLSDDSSTDGEEANDNSRGSSVETRLRNADHVDELCADNIACSFAENARASLTSDLASDRIRNEYYDPDDTSKNDDHALVNPAPSHEHLLFILKKTNLNWFSFVEELKLLFRNYTVQVLHQTLLDFVYYLSNSSLSIDEERQVEQSRQAFLELERQKSSCGMGDMCIPIQKVTILRNGLMLLMSYQRRVNP